MSNRDASGSFYIFNLIFLYFTEYKRKFAIRSYFKCFLCFNLKCSTSSVRETKKGTKTVIFAHLKNNAFLAQLNNPRLIKNTVLFCLTRMFFWYLFALIPERWCNSDNVSLIRVVLNRRQVFTGSVLISFHGQQHHVPLAPRTDD